MSDDDEFVMAVGARPVLTDRVEASDLHLKVRTMEGLNYDIDAKSDWNTRRLKEELKKWTGTGVEDLSLYYRAKKLVDNVPLEDYNIVSGRNNNNMM